MEIKPEEIIQTTETPIELFYKALTNPETRRVYTNVLKKIVCENFRTLLNGDPKLLFTNNKKRHYRRVFSDADFEVRVNEFVNLAKTNPSWAESVILTLVTKLMDRTKLPTYHKDRIQSTMVENNTKALKKLFDMNNVPMTWARIQNVVSNENDVRDKSRGYTLSEIQKIIKFCDPMERVIVLLGASAGIRAGAFTLKWENIFPVYKVENKYVWELEDVTESITEKHPMVCGIIRVYADSYAEYFGLVTPECLEAVQIYKEDWLRETKRLPRPEDPVFKKSGALVRPLTYLGIRKRMEAIVKKAGIRKKIPDTKQKYDIPLFNGFRRFFNKQNKKSLSNQSKLAALILKETMMGHAGLIKLDKNYFKEHIDELIEEYLLAVPNLTIDDAERQKAQNQKLQKELSERESLEKRIPELVNEAVERVKNELKQEGWHNPK